MDDLLLSKSLVIVFCILINIIVLSFVLINKNYTDKRGRIFIGVLAVNFVLLTSFLFRQYFENNPNPSYNTPLLWTASIYQATSQVLLLLHIRLTLQTIQNRATLSNLTKYAAILAAVVVSVNFILSVATPFTHVYFYFDNLNRIVLQDALIISDIATFIWTILTVFILVSNRKNFNLKEMGVLMAYVVLPTIALVFYLMTLNLHFIIYSITLCIITYYSFIQSELAQQIQRQELEINQKELQIKQQELEISESAIATMTSQIQPHFIYNTLAAIKALIRLNPEMAIETVQEFSSYLRTNIDSLSNIKPVSFETELKHVETYLSIENKRFNGKLIVTYDIMEIDFELPSLTIQPIVENAVKHGITSKKSTGGKISIATYKTDDKIIITIIDDGEGYDVTQNPSECESKGVGLENVKVRLSAIVGGTLEIESEINKGTKVTITIPDGDKK